MRYHLGILAAAAIFANACDYNNPSDYDPKEDFRAYQAEQKELAQSSGQDSSQVDPSVAKLNKAKKSYSLYCSSCHGTDGAANTATANALSPKPRNFTDKAWQSSVDDARIAKVIKEGGASVGLSASMAPWGATLSDDEISSMVAIIRGFAK